ncbi:MAG TPA: cupin domain-containing protein [Elusimicrobiota bacterium]|nr:cupin domain-containing protein [Elusimicrobiota bacterium]
MTPVDEMTPIERATDDPQPAAALRRFKSVAGAFRWAGLSVLAYKEEGTHFRRITRQRLFGPEHGLLAELRYFEIAPGGYSTLERHEHAHGVVILRGRGRALVGRRILAVRPFDWLSVPPMTWHQFRAGASGRLGFLCLVNADRDRPQRPDAAALAELRQSRAARQLIRV